MRRPLLALMALLLSAASARAAGVNLRFSNCFGDGALANKNFVCNTNIGINVLTGSFVLPADLAQVDAVEFYVDVATASATLPTWWQYVATGACRRTSLTANSTVPPTAVTCVDWASGQAQGGIESYTTGISGPNTARVIGAFAVVAGAAADLSAGTEYFGFNLVFNNQKTVGIGNCTGCTTPACVAINRINLYTAPDVLSQILTGPAVGFDSHFVSWQGGGSVAGTCATPGGGIPVTTSTLGRGAVTRSNYSSSYSAGQPLTLTAAPSPGARFVAWSGDTATSVGTLDITVENPRSYVATFERDPAASPSIQSVSDVPSDQGSSVNVSWNRSPIDAAATSSAVASYDIQRRATASDPWGTIANVAATQSASYAQAVSTPQDAVDGNPALYDYRVIAKSASPDTALWLSDNVVAGASIDNIAPPDPSSVSGSMASGFASFFWPPVNVPDLASYRIYRGLESSPPADLAHRIATTTSTGYNDNPGYFANYLVTAVDVHGNESAGRLFVPSNSAGTDGRAAPQSLTVGNPSPSPMGGRMSLSLGLPRAMHVSVEILDAQGRLVRTLREGTADAGWFNVSWDARNASGSAAPAGLYFVRVRTGAGEQIKRLVVLP